MQQNKKALYLAQTAVIAALYAAITLAVMTLVPIPGLNHGPIQFRVSEALTMLAVFTPAAIPGLAIGAFLANLLGPYGPPDMIFGTLASLLAALCSYWLRNIQWKKLPILSGIPPVLFNAVIIGAMIAYFFMDTFAWQNVLLFGAQVGLGQLVVVYGLGLPLVVALRKTKLFHDPLAK